MGHARALLALSGPRQVELAHQVVSRALSVRETEQLAGRAEATVRKTPRKHRKDRDLQALEENLAETLGAPVTITPGKHGRGKLVIGYSSLDQLDEFLRKLRR
jgi:ParB family chromosome partitioning protein